MIADPEPLREEFHQYAIPASDDDCEIDQLGSEKTGEAVDINDPRLTAEPVEYDPDADAFARYGTLSVRIEAENVMISALWREF